MILRRLLCITAALTVTCAAQESSVIAGIKSDLAGAQQRLSEQRAELSEEQKALSAQLADLQHELLIKRRQADISRRSLSDTQALLTTLKNKEHASSSAAGMLSDELRAYGIELETKRLPGEQKDERLDGVFLKEGEQSDILKARLSVLEAGLSRLEGSMGGGSYQGTVTDQAGRVIQGDILSFGPARWFVSEDRKVAGSYHLTSSGKVATLREDAAEVAQALASGARADAVIDITGGKAQALADIKSSPLDLIKKGGAWVYPILVIGLLALICVVMKVLQLSKIKEPSESWILGIVSAHLQGNSDEAVQQAGSVRHPVSQVLPGCIEAATHGIDVVEEILYERMITVKESLRRWLPFIATTAAIAPLLGLLGTVSGLIRTFSVIAVEGTGEAQSISGGISEALITTLFGLAIAIPAFMAHSILSRKAKGIEQNTERITLKFINALRQQVTR